MRQNSRPARVLNAAGYYDFATPFFDAEIQLEPRNGDRPRPRCTYTYYESGHMMYVHHESLARLLTDVRAFIGTALARATVGAGR